VPFFIDSSLSVGVFYVRFFVRGYRTSTMDDGQLSRIFQEQYASILREA